MPRISSWLLFLLTGVLIGAQLLIALEAQVFPLLTLGQTAALFWLPDPHSASQSVDAAMATSRALSMLLSLPALPIVFGLWLAIVAVRRRTGR